MEAMFSFRWPVVADDAFGIQLWTHPGLPGAPSAETIVRRALRRQQSKASPIPHFSLLELKTIMRWLDLIPFTGQVSMRALELIAGTDMLAMFAGNRLPRLKIIVRAYRLARAAGVYPFPNIDR